MKANIFRGYSNKEVDRFWENIYVIYGDIMKKRVYDIIGSVDDADDIIRDTINGLFRQSNELIKLWEESKEQFASYLLDSLKIRIVEFTQADDIDAYSPTEEFPEQELEKEHLRDYFKTGFQVNAAMGKVPKYYFLVYRSKYRLGLSDAAIIKRFKLKGPEQLKQIMVETKKVLIAQGRKQKTREGSA